MTHHLHRLALATAAALALSPAAATAAPPTATMHYGSATIRSAPDDALLSDGGGPYAKRLVWVRDQLDPTADDLFAIYTGNRRSLTIRFDGRSVTCVGISHFFFEGAGWWEATDAVGDEFVGGASTWCDTASGPDYWVRYPGMRNEPGEDCVLARRRPDADGRRVYEFTPRDVNSLAGSLLGPVGSSGCDANVYEVVNLGRADETRTVIWSGPSPFLVTASLD